MQWDLGIRGLTLLVVLSLGCGALVQPLAGRSASRWLWAAVAAVAFLAGLLTSEMWFGWATEAELQPNVDGLSFDEVLLAQLLTGGVAVLLTRMLARRSRKDAAPRQDARSGAG